MRKNLAEQVARLPGAPASLLARARALDTKAAKIKALTESLESESAVFSNQLQAEFTPLQLAEAFSIFPNSSRVNKRSA
jgi:hypothetical protein